MPRAGEGRSIKIDPDVYEALLALKRGRMTISDVIAQMLSDCYGWQSDFPAGQRELEDFIGQMPCMPEPAQMHRRVINHPPQRP